MMKFYIKHRDRKTVDILKDSSAQDTDGDYSGSETTVYQNATVMLLPATPGTITKTVSGDEVVASMIMSSDVLPAMQIRDIIRYGSVDYEILTIRTYEGHMECDLRERQD